MLGKGGGKGSLEGPVAFSVKNLGSKLAAARRTAWDRERWERFIIENVYQQGIDK